MPTSFPLSIVFGMLCSTSWSGNNRWLTFINVYELPSFPLMVSNFQNFKFYSYIWSVLQKSVHIREYTNCFGMWHATRFGIWPSPFHFVLHALCTSFFHLITIYMMMTLSFCSFSATTFSWFCRHKGLCDIQQASFNPFKSKFLLVGLSEQLQKLDWHTYREEFAQITIASKSFVRPIIKHPNSKFNSSGFL